MSQYPQRIALGDSNLMLSTDNLVVSWGVQDHYEIVRKVGRGKYSEVSALHGV